MLMNSGPNIHILWNFVAGPWGGGNQFLKALKDKFSSNGIYSDKPDNADIILFNSHQHLDKALKLKQQFPDKIFIHRIDGPISLARGEIGKKTDRNIFLCNRIIADGTIFQSHWSMVQSHNIGLRKKTHEICIINAPDPNIFYAKTYTEKKNNDRIIKLIATSWSSNERKGFDIYHYLDEHLDHKRYSFTFIGNPDKPFTNIRSIPPLSSDRLADALRDHDIFISASKMESCSNSFLEAMHCGLPALARNNTSHPEVLGNNGLLFEGSIDILHKIDQLSSHLDLYRRNLTIIPIEEIAHKYLDFFRCIMRARDNGFYFSRRLYIPEAIFTQFRLKN